MRVGGEGNERLCGEAIEEERDVGVSIIVRMMYKRGREGKEGKWLKLPARRKFSGKSRLGGSELNL